MAGQSWRVLIVDDDESLGLTLSEALGTDAGEVRRCTEARSALDLVESFNPDLVLLDVCLPDGTAFDVLEALRGRVPTPVVVAMSGIATSTDAFRLCQLGVRSFLAKPFGLDELRAAVTQARSEPLDLRPQVRGLVGQRPVQEVEREIREVMVGEALARSRGNRRRAAALLHVSRQLLQYMLRHLDVS